MYDFGAGEVTLKKFATKLGCRTNSAPNAKQLVAFARITFFRLNIISFPMYTWLT